jgi:hypothetical protein
MARRRDLRRGGTMMPSTLSRNTASSLSSRRIDRPAASRIGSLAIRRQVMVGQEAADAARPEVGSPADENSSRPQSSSRADGGGSGSAADRGVDECGAATQFVQRPPDPSTAPARSQARMRPARSITIPAGGRSSVCTAAAAGRERCDGRQRSAAGTAAPDRVRWLACYLQLNAHQRWVTSVSARCCQ